MINLHVIAFDIVCRIAYNIRLYRKQHDFKFEVGTTFNLATNDTRFDFVHRWPSTYWVYTIKCKNSIGDVISVKQWRIDEFSGRTLFSREKNFRSGDWSQNKTWLANNIDVFTTLQLIDLIDDTKKRMESKQKSFGRDWRCAYHWKTLYDQLIFLG